MTNRAYSPAGLDLPAVPLPADQVLEGAPATGLVELQTVPGLDVGVWQHTPGVSCDVEADEVFVVVSGRAVVEPEGGAPFEVGPGDVGVLRAGTRTVWRVTETLRKVYVTSAATGA